MHLVRISCLTNVLCIEEVLGEKIVRVSMAVIVMITGITVCAVQVMSGDVWTGTAFNLITGNHVPEGMCNHSCLYINKFKNNILICSLSTLILRLQAYGFQSDMLMHHKREMHQP
jgi:hypothetical protein